ALLPSAASQMREGSCSDCWK
ncbi:MAG: hypothetical protein DRQ64_00640, partial [Gammaproteobacteria bacterium]